MKSEYKRQFIHFFFGSIVIILIGLIGATNFLVLNTAILAGGYLISLEIKKGNTNLPIINYFLDYAGRKEEKKIPGKGALTFFSGTLIASALFYNNPVLLIGSIIPLVFGDSISTVIGKLFGKIEIIKNKTLEGSSAGFLISFFYLSILFSYQTALIAAFVGMAMEYLPIDDNYTIPAATGFALMLLI